MRNYLLFSFQGPNLRERSLIREYDQRLGDLKRNRRKSVLQTHRVHPFPFRTRKLSCAVLTILCWRRHGKIGQGRHPLSLKERVKELHGGVAQLGEHLPCKQGVMGSNPIISTIARNCDKRTEKRDNNLWAHSSGG